MKRTRKPVVIVGAAVAALALLSGCSSSDASMPQDSGNEGVDVEAGQDPAMLALCDQMIAERLTSAEATALAEENGYTARVGTIDGEPQAVTMDYRLDRFTFETEGDVVVACTYG